MGDRLGKVIPVGEGWTEIALKRRGGSKLAACVGVQASATPRIIPKRLLPTEVSRSQSPGGNLPGERAPGNICSSKTCPRAAGTPHHRLLWVPNLHKGKFVDPRILLNTDTIRNVATLFFW